MSILSQSQPRKKLLIIGTIPAILDMNADSYYDLEAGEVGEIEETAQSLTGSKSQNADDAGPELLYELQVEVFARVPFFEYWKLQFLNKRFSLLVKSSEIFRMRRECGLVKPYIFLVSSGDSPWTIFDEDFKNFQRVPKPFSDFSFLSGGKEITSVGTQLIVIGKEVEGITVWRYEVEMHTWYKDPTMMTPRIMFASASHKTNAFFAGGVKIGENGFEVVSTVEKYDAETKTWTTVHKMHKRRHLCSGCFLRGKLYVFGGCDENDEYLTCAESYNEETDSWELIPNMLSHMSLSLFRAPSRIAVVNDKLYLLETSSNMIFVYNVNTNTWKKVGVVPMKPHVTSGWGVAFKSVGDKLMVIGVSSARPQSQKMAVYKCHPSPDVDEILWEETILCCRGINPNHFILKCCVMFV